MTLSTSSVKLKDTFNILHRWKSILVVAILNYVVLNSIIIIMGFLFGYNKTIWAGIIIMAAVPPAILVIPFSKFLNGDTELAVGATALLYISSLIITPGIVLVFLGTNINIYDLVRELILLIIIPLIISRALMRFENNKRFSEVKPVGINIAIAILIITVVGINRSLFFYDEHLIISLMVIGIIRTLVIGAVIYFLALKFKVNRLSTVTYTLFASYKNLGLTIVLAFALFGPVATIPAAVCVPFEIFAFVYFKKMMLYR